MASRAGNRKIGEKRGSQWVENLKNGRRESMLSPSRIRLIRLKRGLSQEEVAKALGLTESTYQAIERGKRMVDFERANQVAAYFKGITRNLFSKVSKDKFKATLAVYE